MPSPASFPSRLRCSGTVLVDSNGYQLPLMKGININPTTVARGVLPKLSDLKAIYGKGCRYVRAELWWSHAQPSKGPLDSAWLSDLDTLVSNCVSARLYVWFNLMFNGATVMPSWAQRNHPEGSLQNYVAHGQTVTTTLAGRYGNPSSPYYTKAVMGMGINEPVPDYINTKGWVTHLVNEQLQMVTWVRSSNYGDAPGWIVSIAPGSSAGCAMLPNAAGSGQTRQTFKGAPTSPTTNFMLEVHDPVKVADTNTSDPNWPNYDGRDPTYGHIGAHIVQIGDKAKPGYPPSVGSITRDQMKAMTTAWWANYEAYAEAANCPIFLAEGNWDPVVNKSGPGGPDGAAYITDKQALWYGLSPQPAMMSLWDYNRDQSADPFAMRPGTGAGVVGANPDGWTYYADAFFSTPSGYSSRVLQRNSTWYRVKPTSA
jgi:hypothetical protein